MSLWFPFPRSVRPHARLLAGGLLALGLLASLAPFAHREPAAVEEVLRGPRGRRQIALTFDAGGEATAFAALVEALAAADARCTFFLTGAWASRHPALVRELVARGHEIGNHTWTHPHLARAEAAEVQRELLRTDALLAPLLPRAQRPLWRAPFGERNAAVLRAARALGFTSVYWSLDSLDSVDPPKTPEFLIQRVARCRDAELDGAIVLLHVGEPATAAAVPAILADLHRRGLRPVTVSQLLGARR